MASPTPPTDIAQPTGGQTLPEDPKDPGYSHEDLSKQSIRDIASEEPTKEEPKEPVKTPEELEAENKVAQEAREQQVREEERQKVLTEQEEERKKIEEARQTEPSEKEKAYVEWEKRFKSDNNRQPSYLEALQFVEEQAVRGVEERQAKAQQERAQQEEAARKEQEAVDQKLNNVIDDELNDLYKAGKLTKIVDKDNPSDQGVVERKALFTQWATENAKRRQAGQPEITSATRMFEFYYQKPNAMPPGSDAPIQGNRGSQVIPPTADNPGYTNADLKKSWGWFRRG